jgi:hypothetical protein
VINSGRYSFILDGAVFPLPTAEIGEDSGGPYALVETTDIPLAGGWWLSIEPNPQEDAPEAPCSCTIALLRPRPEYIPSGAERDAGNELSVPIKDSLEVGFGPDGSVTSWSCTAKRPPISPRLS